MVQLRDVSQSEKIVFPIMLLLLVGLLLPSATPLLGMLCLGNLMKESLGCRPAKRCSSELIDKHSYYFSRAGSGF